MIITWNTHEFYQNFIAEGIKFFMETQSTRVLNFKNTIAKLTSLNLDPLFEILKPHYSRTGRPAKVQAEIFRSFILMLDQGETSVTNWIETLKSDDLLALLIGCTPEALPPLGSYYDFIDRLWLRQKSIDRENRKRLRTFNRKPIKKIGKTKNFQTKIPGLCKKSLVSFLPNVLLINAQNA